MMMSDRSFKNFMVVCSVVVILLSTASVVMSGMVLWKSSSPIVNVVSADIEKTPMKPSVEKKDIEVVKSAAQIRAEKLELATVGKSGGPVDTFTKQMVANPEFFGYKVDLSGNKPMSIRTWSENQATVAAELLGYIQRRLGGQIGVLKPDQVALVLDKDEDGNLICNEYVKGKDGQFPDEPTRTIKAAKSIDQAKFLAQEDENGDFHASASYEYLWVPKGI